jgi:hypothetical protein
MTECIFIVAVAVLGAVMVAAFAQSRELHCIVGKIEHDLESGLWKSREFWMCSHANTSEGLYPFFELK